MPRQREDPRFSPSDGRGQEFKRWVIAVLLGWLFGLIQLPPSAPIFRLASLQTIAQWVLGAIATYLLFRLIGYFSPWVDYSLKRLAATRWSALLIVLLVVACFAVGFNGFPLQRWVSTPAALGTVYFAATPGPGCDTQSQRWSQRSKNGSMSCTTQGMELSLSGFGNLNEVAFDPYGLPGDSSLHAQPYCVQVSAIIISGGPNTAVIVGVHIPQVSGGDLFEVTEPGIVTLASYDSSGNPELDPPLFNEPTSAAQTYRLEVGVDGAQISLWINGRLLARKSDSAYSSTRYVLLALQAGDTQPAAALFFNFSFQFNAASLARCGSM